MNECLQQQQQWMRYWMWWWICGCDGGYVDVVVDVVVDVEYSGSSSSSSSRQRKACQYTPCNPAVGINVCVRIEKAIAKYMHTSWSCERY